MRRSPVVLRGDVSIIPMKNRDPKKILIKGKPVNKTYRFFASSLKARRNFWYIDWSARKQILYFSKNSLGVTAFDVCILLRIFRRNFLVMSFSLMTCTTSASIKGQPNSCKTTKVYIFLFFMWTISLRKKKEKSTHFIKIQTIFLIKNQNKNIIRVYFYIL